MSGTELAKYGSTTDTKLVVGDELNEPLLTEKQSSEKAGNYAVASRLAFCGLLLLIIPVLIYLMSHNDFGVVGSTALLGTGTAISMLVGSLVIVALRSVSEVLQGALQNFSAGIIISAVGCELFPLITDSGGGAIGYVAITAGFVVGLGLMFGVGWLLDDDDDDDESVANGGESPKKAEADRLRGHSFHEEDSREVDDMTSGSQEAISALIASLRSEAEGRCDREKLDEMIHQMEYLIDKARRKLRGEVSLSDRNKRRIVEHIQEIEEALKLRSPEGGGMFCATAVVLVRACRHVPLPPPPTDAI
jgi:hypothetical protein